MAFVHRPGVFLVVAALAGMGWTLSASELWVASQRAMPGLGARTHERHHGDGLAGGDCSWGDTLRLAAHNAGVVPTFLGAAVFGILIMIIVRVVPGLPISIDFTKSVSFNRRRSLSLARALTRADCLRPKMGRYQLPQNFMSI